MVFGRLFGSSSSGAASRQNEPEPPAPDRASTEEIETQTHAAAETVEVSTSATKPPLSAVPDFVLSDHPELKLEPYDLKRSNYCQNVIAMPHNAVKLEIADMYADILPSLQSTAEVELTREDADDLSAWWSGFARFALTTSLVDDFVVEKAYKDVYLGFDKDTQGIETLYQKFKEKNEVYLEMAFRKMGKAVDEFGQAPSLDAFNTVIKFWQILAGTLTDIYSLVEDLIDLIDRWCREPMEYKDLEKSVAKIYTNKKRWGDSDTKRGEMIIVLTRWVGSEQFMREWMNKNLTKKEVKACDRWMDDYRANRLTLIDKFHQSRQE